MNANDDSSDNDAVDDMLFDAVQELGLMPKNLCALHTAAEIATLWKHIGNDSDPFQFAMSFRSDANELLYRKSATKSYEQAISWSIATIQGKKPGKEMSLVPYATNRNACSRWAVMDFDAHRGEIRRAYAFARDSYRHFEKRKPDDIIVFLEHTGAGGWHLWLISLDFHPCTWWVGLLKEVAAAIGAPVQSGVCELFPNE